MKNKISDLFKKSGFHIILFVCISVLAITGVMAAKGKTNKEEADNLSKEEDFVIVSEEEPTMEISKMEEYEDHEDEKDEKEEKDDTDLDFVEEEMEPQAQEKEVETGEKQEEPKAMPSGVEMVTPVDGELGVDFTTDNLIYSETLEEWTSHKGIDIFAKEGQEVRAALSGQVTEIYEDELWGKVIIIDHGNGLMTKYANLSTMDLAKEGKRVEKGTVISKVGNTAAIEMIMEPHIHFEVIKDGVNVDPKDYISTFSK